MSNWAKISPSAVAPARMRPIVLHNAIASPLAPPAATGGGDISPSRDDAGFGPVDGEITITGSAATVITGPVGIFGEKDDGSIVLLGTLNNGANIVIVAAAVGFSQQVSGCGIFKKLQLGGIAANVTWTAGNLTVKYTPMLIANKVP